MTIQTSVGLVNVLHRLALGVECMDPLTDRLVLTPVRVGRELQREPFIPVRDPRWPCATLMRSGPARFKVGYDVPLPTEFVVRVDDPTRRLVPRRLKVRSLPVDTLDAVPARAAVPAHDGIPAQPAVPAQPYVPVDHRLLRVWMWPGSAAPLPVGSTVVRGRVLRDGVPARWARVTATGPNGGTVGHAHADDRGEFVLVVTDAEQAPLESTIPLDLDVIAAVDARGRGPAGPVRGRGRGGAADPGRTASAGDAGHRPAARGPTCPPATSPTSSHAHTWWFATGVETTLPDDLVFGLTP